MNDNLTRQVFSYHPIPIRIRGQLYQPAHYIRLQDDLHIFHKFGIEVLEESQQVNSIYNYLKVNHVQTSINKHLLYYLFQPYFLDAELLYLEKHKESNK